MEYNFELLPAQKEFWNITHNYGLDVALYQGGYGSGKTWCGSLLGIMLACQYAGIKGLVGALTFPLVRDTTLNQYQQHLDNMGFVPNVHYTYEIAKSRIVFWNGSEILFRHFEEPNKLKSLNLGFVEIEEMSDVPESTFKMLLSRLRQTNKWGDKFQYRLFGHTNPESSKGYIYKYFVEQKQPNYRFIQAPTTQNKFLPAHYVEELKNAYDEDYFRINVLGEFGDYTSGLVVKNFTSENIKKIHYQPDMDLHISCDFNVGSMMWVLAHKTEDKVFYFDEIVLEDVTTEETIQEVIRRYPDHKGRIIINGDAAGQFRNTQSKVDNYVIMRNALRRHYPNNEIHLAIRPCNPPVKRRIAGFNAMVKDYKGNRRIFVDKKCKWLLYNFYNLKYKKGTNIIDLPSPQKIKENNDQRFLMHIFDACSYLVEYYFPLRIEEKFN